MILVCILIFHAAKRMGRYSLQHRTNNIIEVKAIEAKADGSTDTNAVQLNDKSDLEKTLTGIELFSYLQKANK